MTIKTPTIKSDAKFEIKIKKIKFKYLSSDKDFSTNDDLRSIIKLKAKTTTTTKKLLRLLRHQQRLQQLKRLILF